MYSHLRAQTGTRLSYSLFVPIALQFRPHNLCLPWSTNSQQILLLRSRFQFLPIPKIKQTHVFAYQAPSLLVGVFAKALPSNPIGFAFPTSRPPLIMLANNMPILSKFESDDFHYDEECHWNVVDVGGVDDDDTGKKYYLF